MQGKLGISFSFLVCQVDEEGVIWPIDAVENHKDEGKQVHRNFVDIFLELLCLLIIHVFSNLSVDPR